MLPEFPVEDLYKHNDYIKMIQLKNQMSMQQQRIFDTILASIQEMKKTGQIAEVVQEGELVMNYEIFRKQLVKGSKTKRVNRKELEEALSTMVDIKFTYSVDDEIGAFVIFQKARINFTDNKVYLTFGKDFRTENLLPTANYTALSMSYLNSFTSQHARLLYQYFKMLIGSKGRPFRTDITLEITYIYGLFGISEEKSTYFKNKALFIKQIIQPAINQINMLTDIDVSMEVIRRGRFLNEIRFIFDRKSTCSAEFEQLNFKENKKPALDVSFVPAFTEFRLFRKWLLANMSGKPIIKGPDGYEADTIISLTFAGYLKNEQTQRDLLPDEAMLLWGWLFKNQDRVGQFEFNDIEIRCLNLKNKAFMAEDEENLGKTQKYIIKEVVFCNKDDLIDVKLEKEDGAIIELKEIFTLSQLELVEKVD